MSRVEEGGMKKMAKVCRKCDGPLVRRPDMYYWRGVFMHGWICIPCNSLWDLGGAFIKYAENHGG